MRKKQIYLDHNATTPLHPEVKKVMTEVLEEFGNPSSMHSFGRNARQRIEEARGQVASLINASPDEIVFMGSGSETNNTVLSLTTCPLRECNLPELGLPRVITSKIEHPCILETSKCIAGNSAEMIYLNVDSFGRIDMNDYTKKISKNTLLVSIMMANNEIGTIQNIEEIAKIAREYGALVHSDAVQAVGKIPVNVKELDLDFLSMSAHKIYGPKGVGALYIKKGAPFCPMIHGGHQEGGRRAGTENTLGIVGFGKAAEMRALEMNEEAERILKLKNLLVQGIKDSITNVQIIGDPHNSLPGTLNVSFEGVEGEAVLLYLDMEGIAVSTGSACASGSLDPSHVILATGLPRQYAHGSIRISLGRDTTKEEIEYTIAALIRIVEKLRKMSTFKTG
ncbi:MAG: aminotransferase class V-fold PLP-dependent enzyme [bacterium]